MKKAVPKLLSYLQRKTKSSSRYPLQVVTDPVPRIFSPDSDNRPRALLSYLVQPVIDELQGGATYKFSNDGIARTWPKILSKLGYAVDIINWDDKTYSSRRNYDLIIGHGALNFKELKKAFPESPYIYFSTGSYWKFHNQQEDSRLEYFAKRHGVNLPRDRYITFSEEACNQEAIGIIALGNAKVAETYNKFKNVINIPIGCYPDDRYETIVHDFEGGKKNFLFFSGAGNVHKGLDLLLDTFKDLPDYTLHICTFVDKEFGRYYKDVLALPNIRLHEFVDLRSDTFYKIIDSCNYVIFPSCSEGSPGSVVECMINGLIPVVSEDAHIDIGHSGLVVSDCTVENIKDAVRRISTKTTKELRSLSEEARRIATTTHAPTSFEYNLERALKNTLRGNV